MGKICPKDVELILEINKTVIVASSWCSIFTLPIRELEYFLVWIIVTIYSDSVFFFFFWQRSFESAIDLTVSFKWEELPTRDADTGHLTAAGWIPLIKTYAARTAVVLFVFHTVQSSIRIVTNHETMLIAWYPFDWTVSPFYELVNISQVKLSINLRRSIYCLNCFYIINLTGLILLFSLFIFSVCLLSFLHSFLPSF
jgi:hypothetical protein